MKHKLGSRWLLFLGLSLASCSVFAISYQLPSNQDDLVGQVQYISTTGGDNAVSITRKYDLGYNALESANPELNMNRSFPQGLSLLVPTQFLLPSETREGIVVNLPEMRMYYFTQGKVYTYPIGIGKVGKTIPIINTLISKKKVNPNWIPPEDIREWNIAYNHLVLPAVMPAGPDNPLGKYAIYLRLPTYLIHSTIFPESIGKRASFGCIRMYVSDIEKFFPSVKRGVPVFIINDPVKIGWAQNHLYLESHEPLEEHTTEFDATLPGVIHLVSAVANKNTLVDWQEVAYINAEHDGIPHDIGIKLNA
jgi:L,D-transpeptidase ErfK/SrfK